MKNNPLGIAATLTTQSGEASYASLAKLAAMTHTDVGQLPHTVKILLENLARRAGDRDVTEADVVALAQ
jgi:aconitate hydratase